MKEVRRLFYVIIDDWADNWKRYVVNGILLFVFVQLLRMLAVWFENNLPG